MLRKSNLVKMSELLNRNLAPKVWCDRLALACRNGGDLAKMVTVDVKDRATAKDLLASLNFPGRAR